MSNPYIPDQLHNMSKKELLEFAQTAHEENVKLAQKLAKANERIEGLEDALLDECSVFHCECDLNKPRDTLKNLLAINAEWALDPQISSDAARFALEQKIEVLQELVDEDKCGTRHVYYRALSKIEQLYKEQE